MKTIVYTCDICKRENMPETLGLMLSVDFKTIQIVDKEKVGKSHICAECYNAILKHNG